LIHIELRLWKVAAVPKWSNMTKYTSKLGQGPKGPQHSPVTHPKSRRSVQFFLKCLELGSSCFDLLQCDNLFLSKFLDHCVIEWSFQTLFCSDDNLFEFSFLVFKFRKKLACLFLDQLKPLGDFHHFTLQRMYLLQGFMLFYKPLHSFNQGQSLYLHL
jgi:hypothetical protein